MSTRTRPADQGRRLGQRLRQALGLEFREARLALGLSQAIVGAAAALSPTIVGRIERGVLTSVSLEQLTRVSIVLGLDLMVRVYPGGRPVRDHAQLALIERFRAVLHPSLGLRFEVPIPIAGDRRAWDAHVLGTPVTIGLEAETRLRDVQAVERRIALKMRDSSIDQVILLLADTHTNRAAIHDAGTSIQTMFPVSARSALRAFREGRDPGGSAVILR
jgi:transcriptional regulator with XRE-family HTH domain